MNNNTERTQKEKKNKAESESEQRGKNFKPAYIRCHKTHHR